MTNKEIENLIHRSPEILTKELLEYQRAIPITAQENPLVKTHQTTPTHKINHHCIKIIRQDRIVPKEVSPMNMATILMDW